MSDLALRISFKRNSNKEYLKVFYDYASLRTLGLTLNQEFNNRNINIGDVVNLDGTSYRIVDTKCSLNETDEVTTEFPYNIDLRYYVEEVV